MRNKKNAEFFKSNFRYKDRICRENVNKNYKTKKGEGLSSYKSKKIKKIDWNKIRRKEEEMQLIFQRDKSKSNNKLRWRKEKCKRRTRKNKFKRSWETSRFKRIKGELEELTPLKNRKMLRLMRLRWKLFQGKRLIRKCKPLWGV